MAPERPAKRTASPSVPSATKRSPGHAARRRVAEPTVDAAPDTATAADLVDETRPGGETHQVAGGERPRLTTQQGIPVADDQNTLQGRRAWAVAARGLPLPREDLPLRPRADPRAGRARPRLRRPRLLRAVRVAGRRHPGRPVPAARRADPGVRALLHRGRQQGLVRPRPRRPRLRREVLHAGRQLGPRRQQHPGLLHPGRHQVPRRRPRRQAGARSRLPPGPVGPRQLLGLHLADARGHPHGDVDDVGPGDPPVVPLHGGLRRPHVPLRRRRRRRRRSSSSTGSRSWACSRWCGTRPSRSTAPTPTSTAATCGTPSTPATSRSGSSASSCSTTSSPTRSTSTSSTPPRSSPRSSCRCAAVGRLVLDRTVDNFFAETEQVAFCTQNVVPGIDFTNDPLLQGRNFSYLDTQLKRLGGPNFTHLPVNAPKCPVAHFQQDGHMAIINPVGPRQLRAELVGRGSRRPARGPRRRLPQLRRGVNGTKQRVRSERFADHYSQARQFYISQTPVEQTAHRRRLRVRAVQVRAAGHPRPHGGQPPQRRRGLRPTRRRRPAPRPAPRAVHAGAPADHRPPAVAGAEHRGQRPRQLRRPQDRRARHRRHRRRAARRVAQGRSGRGRAGRAHRPPDRRRRPQRRRTHAGPPEDRRRPVGALRRRGDPRRPPRARRCSPRTRRPRTSSPTPTPTASSSPTPPTPWRCSTPPGWPQSSTTATSHSTDAPLSPRSSKPIGTSATGPAPPASPRPDRELDIQTGTSPDHVDSAHVHPSTYTPAPSPANADASTSLTARLALAWCHPAHCGVSSNVGDNAHLPRPLAPGRRRYASQG